MRKLDPVKCKITIFSLFSQNRNLTFFVYIFEILLGHHLSAVSVQTLPLSKLSFWFSCFDLTFSVSVSPDQTPGLRILRQKIKTTIEKLEEKSREIETGDRLRRSWFRISRDRFEYIASLGHIYTYPRSPSNPHILCKRNAVTSVVNVTNKGTFNDYVDIILPFYDHHLPLRGHF